MWRGTSEGLLFLFQVSCEIGESCNLVWGRLFRPSSTGNASEEKSVFSSCWTVLQHFPGLIFISYMNLYASHIPCCAVVVFLHQYGAAAGKGRGRGQGRVKGRDLCGKGSRCDLEYIKGSGIRVGPIFMVSRFM